MISPRFIQFACMLAALGSLVLTVVANRYVYSARADVDAATEAAVYWKTMAQAERAQRELIEQTWANCRFQKEM